MPRNTPSTQHARPWGTTFGILGFGAFLLAFAWLRSRAHVVGWRNYQGQPISVFLVAALGVIVILIGLIDLAVGGPARRRKASLDTRHQRGDHP